ncbi:MAG: hypothetical protein AAF629_17585 [Chloroflexota bacterium]
MNKEEALDWIDMVLDALDQSEVIEIIKETIAADQAGGEFFETLDQESERYKKEGDAETAERLTRIAATVASVRQNRKEYL